MTVTREDVKVLSTDVPGDHRGHWWHVQIGADYYVVSAVDLQLGLSIPGYRDCETMAFPADADAEVTSWGEVAFVPYMDHEACIADLLASLNEGEVSGE